MAILLPVALGIVGVLMMIKMNRSNLPRGIRNNNPGNIKRNTIQWQGMRPIQTDPTFVQFVSPEYGFRAMAKILRSYERRGLISIAHIITTYAPSIENETQAYIDFVATRLGKNPDEPLNLDQDMPALLQAIATFENGAKYEVQFDLNSINEGIALAESGNQIIA